MRTLREIGIESHRNAREKGFWDGFEPGKNDTEFYLMKLALIHSEVTEILEAYRKEQGPAKVADEFADVVIRLTDLFQVMEENGLVDLDLDEAISVKQYANTKRPHMHGVLA